jgi:hypothetical protein
MDIDGLVAIQTWCGSLTYSATSQTLAHSNELLDADGKAMAHPQRFGAVP